MLRPQDTATRDRKALDGLWRFRLDVVANSLPQRTSHPFSFFAPRWRRAK